MIDSLRRAPAEDVATALAIVEAACQPAEPSLVLTELTRCFAVTKAKDASDANLESTLTIMVDDLNDFPPDVVRDALRSYARQERFRPSLAEVREYCWARFGRRQRLREALRYVVRYGEMLTDPPPPPTSEEREKVAAIIAEGKKQFVSLAPAAVPGCGCAYVCQFKADPCPMRDERRDRPSAEAMEIVRKGMTGNADL